MTTELKEFTVTLPEGASARIDGDVAENGIRKVTFTYSWNDENAIGDAEIKTAWKSPMTGYLYKWTPLGEGRYCIHPDWCGPRSSMLACDLPLEVIFDGNDVNRYTWALSECAKNVQYFSGVVEEDGCAALYFRFRVKQYGDARQTSVTLYIDTESKPICEAAAGAASWWADECGMVPAFVPEAAREPVYSFWYSYHQNVTDREVEAECRRAKDLGFNVCIVDDGWQTGDNNRGYAYCGDWEPCPEKFPDFPAHVERVHAIGMKYILWFSVPFVGIHSKNYERFKDMALYLNNGLGAIVLDPRYREVREFLTGLYVKAITEWHLDGLKLDFVDTWRDGGNNAPANDRMDTPVLQDAADVFMTGVMKTLKAIKSDILLEFRQSYVGPHMRRYGNMFRVADCPNDYISNRVGVLGMRMHLGTSAVHSDMLMWHKDESPEVAAVQIINILFGVMQYSARLDTVTEETREMSRFWLSFMKEHEKLLLESSLTPYEPAFLFTWAKAANDGECICAVYAPHTCVVPDDKKTVYLANGTMASRILAELAGSYRIVTRDCRGRIVSDETRTLAGVNALPVPVGGLVTLTRLA